MKYTLILISIALVACASSKREGVKHPAKNVATSYKVYKIDSINTYYLIYARGHDTLFKIVSKKNSVKSHYKIKVNTSYEFKLHSSLLNRHIGAKILLPQNSLLVNCFSYDDKTQICLEGDSIRDLYYAENIKGLYFIKTKR
ncbi:hypothetical protein [Mucilaginibacter jinjuensis]|uniref:Lipoprotein n=1 Tax=Mucilaginibacter jinjuensis TaxID=1176721 RepID=A0ABY7TB19_9SPHI|nr:hypothetical protein [Mucilaginibacter jinjuensis]WCT13636.1 hypothetical protein PQO05_06770 [Mucilaginibacter jinjuensis]